MPTSVSSGADLLARGRAAARIGDLSGAEGAFLQLARENPKDPTGWHNLAVLRAKAGWKDAAAVALRRRLILTPGFGLAWRLAADIPVGPDARTVHARAVCDPAAPHLSVRTIGAARHSQGHLEDADALYRRALILDPGEMETAVNRAAVLNDLGRSGSLTQAIERAMAIEPAHARGRGLRGWDALRRRQWGGIDDYGARWSVLEPGSRAAPIGSALWGGDRVEKLALYGQFGIGDEILFGSVIGDAASRAGAVVVETDPRLVGLFQRTYPNVSVVPRCDPIDPRLLGSDAQASTAYLPTLLRRDPSMFPADGAYLKPDTQLVAHWKSRFADLGPAPHIGVAWRGGVKRTGDAKSTTIEELSTVLRTAMPGGTLVSLQYGEDNTERATAEAVGAWVPHSNPSTDLRDDMETLAAQITALDAVISISGINAHMAGALGRPGVVILPKCPLWFWFDEGDRTPFYPSLQLVRRTGHGLPSDLSDKIQDVLDRVQV
jgi:hypothetical protein